jgi:hypothetical protein
MAVRTGLAIPLGKVAGGSDGTSDLAMSDVFSPQVPIVVDLGGKPIPNLFIGGYIALGFGGAAGITADNCHDAHAGCVATSVGIGAEIQYQLFPGENLNPWFGYGIGFAESTVGGDSGGTRQRVSVTGPDFAHFSAGLDFRLSKDLGIGPMIDFTLGKYTREKLEGGSSLSVEADIPNTTIHEWLTIGARLVIFP